MSEEEKIERIGERRNGKPGRRSTDLEVVTRETIAELSGLLVEFSGRIEIAERAMASIVRRQDDSERWMKERGVQLERIQGELHSIATKAEQLGEINDRIAAVLRLLGAKP